MLPRLICRIPCYAAAFMCLQPILHVVLSRKITETELRTYREKVHEMFYHAYDNYMKNAYPYDELRPLSCDGVDTWGSFSLTLIDALDTLAVMGNYTEFRRVAQLLIDNANFDMNINVSVFETNIRVVGGLLSAHLLSYRAGLPLEAGWPCSGPLLRLAEDLARRILPAFETDTGMPYGTVNLQNGVPQGETPVTCTAGVATFIVEFGTLSRLTGDPTFENVAIKALYALWNAKSRIGLVGNHIDVISGKWTAVDSGIGAGVDSYYEYLVKGSILLQKPELMTMFNSYRETIQRYMMRDDWYMWVNMQKGQVTFPIFQSLEAYWPGLLALIGDIDGALKTIHNYHQVWKQFGFTPEFYNIPQAEPGSNREGYPLRPELVESLMYLYKATKDPQLIQMGIDITESIQHSAKTPCGYATIKDVRTHAVEDRMESFFLAETTKYLFLLFDPDNFLHGNGSRGTIVQTAHGECLIDAGGYIFNTEAHPIDVASAYCCGAAKEEDALLEHFHDNMDLLALLGLEDDDFLKPFRNAVKQRRKRLEWPPLSAPTMPATVTKEDSESQETYVNSTDLLQNFDSSMSNQSEADSQEFEDIQEHHDDSDTLVSTQSADPQTIDSRIQQLDGADDSFLVDSVTPSSLSVKEVDANVLNSNDAVIAVNSDDVGVGQVLFLGDVPISEHHETDSNVDQDECTEKITTVSETADTSKRADGIVTKPAIRSVARDTLYSSGLSGVNGIGLMGVERNESLSQKKQEKVPSKYEVLACPAQPFTIRFSIMGEMFDVD